MEPTSSFPKLTMVSKRKPWRFLILLLGIALILGGSFFIVARPPARFPTNTTIRIPPGVSTHEAGDLLEKAGVVRFSSIFQFLVKIVLAGRPVIAGDFSFEKPYDTLRIARLVTGGGFGGTQARITIPEGSSVAEIASIIKSAIPGWDSKAFLAEAKSHEGFLFPETYIIFKTMTPSAMVELLKKEYSKKISPLSGEIASSGHTEKDLIIMASLLEKEAKSESEAAIISGILWKRLKSGTPLQVDAPFLYTLGKTSAELTNKDLKKDGPYNTYTRKGLPIGPIGNPGLAMIRAAIHPVSSPYLFYLHDSSGTVHFAKTYAEHVANKKKYLH